MADVLVTGGRGFVGSALVRALVERGSTVRVLDNNWRESGDGELPEGVDVVEADVRDADAIHAAVAGVRAVAHLAAVQGTRNFYERPDIVLDVNLRGVLNVAEACGGAGVGRLLLASSSEVYGIPAAFPTPETEPLVVPDVLNARYSYGGTKIAGELVAVNYARRRGYDFTIVRYHNVYGPRMGWDHVIPEFIRRLELGEEFTVQGDGEQRRSFCFVDDAVDATAAALLLPSGANEIFNIGNPAEEHSINDLVRMLSALTGTEIEPRYVEFPGEGTRRRVPDISRAQTLLGFAPRVSFQEGLDATYRWYRAELTRMVER